jgi:hypothetical protein
MSLKKRPDCCKARTISAVQIQFSQDNGTTWHSHENGKWFSTGQLPSDNGNMERKFEIDPPVNGNSFRVIIDKAHTKGANIQGRFDLWVVKNTEYVPKEFEEVSKRAMMDLNGVFTASS